MMDTDTRPTLRELIENRRVHVLDGAMGTALYGRGVFVSVCYDGLKRQIPGRQVALRNELAVVAAVLEAKREPNRTGRCVDDIAGQYEIQRLVGEFELEIRTSLKPLVQLGGILQQRPVGHGDVVSTDALEITVGVKLMVPERVEEIAGALVEVARRGKCHVTRAGRARQRVAVGSAESSEGQAQL